MSDAEQRTREAISKTAKTYREQAAKGGRNISQTEAEARVRSARQKRDRKDNQ